MYIHGCRAVASLKNKGQVFFGAALANNDAQSGAWGTDVRVIAGRYPIGKGLDDVVYQEPMGVPTSSLEVKTSSWGNTKILIYLQLAVVRRHHGGLYHHARNRVTKEPRTAMAGKGEAAMEAMVGVVKWVLLLCNKPDIVGG